MSKSTNAILQRAHELIENNQHEQAQEVLVPLLESEAENPAFWWVYAHAVSDSAIGTGALDRVLQLDPTYPGARELKTDVLAVQDLVAAEIEDEPGLAATPQAFSDSSSIDDWEDIKPVVEIESENPRAGRGFVLLIVALLVIASGVLLVLSGVIDVSEIITLFEAPTQEPVIVVSVSTEAINPTDISEQPSATNEPTAVATEAEAAVTVTEASSTAVPTEVPAPASTSLPTFEPTAVPAPISVTEFIALVARRVSGFVIDVEQSSLRATELGETVDMLVCAEPGEQFNERLNGVLDKAVDLHNRIPVDVEAVAVSLVNCSDPNATVRTIGVSRDILDDFATDDIDRKSFQQSWQPLS